ncbi:YtxH domain-containing protein [Arsenicicoccus dermatophilus]|uniref:YtxH domain-containing protein n=1 Tax=Arsenicicoccus dermatophilus TaxID=1076331 RepID=UPI001F4C8FEC|nr:YtxH domain-containing protein [Arsenicicoccus dermatophilus]MCH8611627.1 YtxH domain-containing protein [Arsenicicoccus dermatophilus]
MQNRLMFVAGAGLGYVLGASAGRSRYQQIKAQADQAWHDPRVQEKVALAQTKVQEKAPVVQAKAQGLAATAGAKLQEKAPAVQERAQQLAATASAKASGAASTVKAKLPGTGADHTGNQIGVERTSDVDTHDVKFTSGS